MVWLITMIKIIKLAPHGILQCELNNCRLPPPPPPPPPPQKKAKKKFILLSSQQLCFWHQSRDISSKHCGAIFIILHNTINNPHLQSHPAPSIVTFWHQSSHHTFFFFSHITTFCTFKSTCHDISQLHISSTYRRNYLSTILTSCTIILNEIKHKIKTQNQKSRLKKKQRWQTSIPSLLIMLTLLQYYYNGTIIHSQWSPLPLHVPHHSTIHNDDMPRW